MQDQWENYLQQFSSKTYLHTTLVSHTGVLVAFAMDSRRRFYYTVLDQQDEPDPVDARNWSITPQELIFPNEIAQVGFRIVANKVIPSVRLDGNPALNRSEVDLFLSTTARLTADSPFQVISDNQYIYLFRQAIDADDQNMITVDNTEDGQIVQTSIVNNTLLVDRFILSGTTLKNVREVRYRRSQHKFLPSNNKDSLGGTDMNNRPFYEPTLELDFVSNMTRGRFAVVQVPTAVPDVKRWQIFTHNKVTGRIDAYNVERSAEGLFNTQGTESPAAFSKMGHAESALSLNNEAVMTAEAQIVNKTGFNISFWIKPDDAGSIYMESVTNQTIFNVSLTDTTQDVDGESVVGLGIRVASFNQTIGAITEVDSEPNVVQPGEWNHISVSVELPADSILVPDNSGLISIQVGKIIVNEANQSLPFPTSPDSTAKLTVGQGISAAIDELSIWDRARSKIEIDKTKGMRKTASEPGLITYWQFDEGNGTTMYDQTDTMNNARIEGGAEWILSDAPIGDNPGIRRSSFGFEGRSIEGKGLSAILYHQQESFPSGDDGNPAPIKQNARVLLATATGVVGETNNKIAVLDFAVNKRGRLTQLPDNINLPSISTSDNDPKVLIEQIINLEQNDIPQSEQRIDDLIAEIERQNVQLGIYRRRFDRNQQSIDNLLTNSGATLFQQSGYGGVHEVLTVGDYARFTPVIDGRNNSINLDDGVIAHLYKEYDFGGEPAIFDKDGARLGGTYFAGNFRSAKIIASARLVRRANLYEEENRQVQFRIDELETTILPDLQQRLQNEQQHLQSLRIQHADLFDKLNGRLSFAMQLLHIDSNGFNSTGGLLDFAWTRDAPTLFESADGNLRLYFRGHNNQFFSATYDTNVARASLTLNNSVQLNERAPGQGRSEAKVVMAGNANDGTTVTITDSDDPDTCTVSLVNSHLNINETWRNVPRSPSGFGRVLGGLAGENVYLGRLNQSIQNETDTLSLSEPVGQSYQFGAAIVIGGNKVALRAAIKAGDTEVSVVTTNLDGVLPAGTTIDIVEYDYAGNSLYTASGEYLNAPYDLQYGSLLVELSWRPVGNIENIPTAVLTGLSQPNSWISDSPGTALDFRSGFLSGDTADMAHQGDLALEAWINPEKTLTESTAYLIEQHTADSSVDDSPPASQYRLGIKKGFEQTAMEFNGADEYIDAGPFSLSTTSFTVESWAKRDQLGQDKLFSTILSLGTATENELLHMGFHSSGVFRFGFYFNDLDSTGKFFDTDWHHWACTFDRETRKRVIYRDGEKIAEDISPANFKGNGNLLFAKIVIPNNELQFNGALDEIRVWRKARSQAEIEATRLCRLQGDEVDLISYYYFENNAALNRVSNTVLQDAEIMGSPRQIDSPLPFYQVFASVRQRHLITTQLMGPGEWRHAAASYVESYALQFNGFNAYLDCGNQISLGNDDGMTIEMAITLPRNVRTFYPLLQKGRIGQEDPELTCWLYMTRESTTRYRIYFGYEDTQGRTHVIAAEVSPTFSTSSNLAVICSRNIDDYRVRLFWNGSFLALDTITNSTPVTNTQALEIGRCRGTPQGLDNPSINGNNRNYLSATVSEIRVWNRALDTNELHQWDANSEKLSGYWRLHEGEGNHTRNLANNSDARIINAGWVADPDTAATRLNIYINGLAVPTTEFTAPPVQENQYHLGRNFQGEMDEVRIWRQQRSQEQIQDNLFTTLKGEQEQLLAYYQFDSSTRENGKIVSVNDSSLRGNTLLATSVETDIEPVLSTAPLADDIALVRNTLGSTPNQFQGMIESRPAIAEYADIQNVNGQTSGIHKRCYSFIDQGQWHLLTGYKVGNLITEWISQVQFDPQVKGYIEGAPPVPSENLTAGPVNDASSNYANTSSVEFIEADAVSYTLSTSKDSSFTSSFEGSLSASVDLEIKTIVAPLGIGLSLPVLEGKASFGQSAKLDTELKWSGNDEQTYGTNVSRMTSVSLGGSWENPAIESRLNKAMSRRYQPANVGFALVESETADLFAIRMAHNRALVAFRMIPNPDIPKDTNIIPFPINSRYSKQGTLDGAVGYNQTGKVLDPDYPQAATYGEYSYFKPGEAYTLRNRIKTQELRLRTFYEDFSTTPPGANGALAGGLGGLAVGAAAYGPAAPLVAGAGVAAGGLIDALASDNDLPELYGKRDLVNTYVWTADGGLYAESTQTTDVQQESTSGSYNFTGNTTSSASGSLGAGGVSVNLEVKASFGGSLNLTKSKSEESSQSFNISLVNNTTGDLQAFSLDEQGALARDDAGRPIRAYDAENNPINVPGKVDAYRFNSFYLTPATDNYDTLFDKVIDPVWLEQDNSANAQALRQARQPQGGPACWRIFHRVTFVSRILPDFPDPTAPPLDQAIQGTDLNSSYELIKRLQPFVQDATGSLAEFDAAVRKSIDRYLPELSSGLTQDVVTALAEYFGVSDDN